MFYRSLGLSRWLTACLLICFIAPQDVCLSCLVTRLAASDRVEDTYCDCCGVVGAMDETGDDYGSPIQIPYDDSNCPSCIMKSMGIILNPAVEVQRQPEEFSAFSGVLSFEAVAFGCRLVESANSPPSDSHQVFHLRI